MRFDLLLAVFSSGLWVPLSLMAFGFLLALGGAIFLWQRRKKTVRRVPEAQEVAIDEASIEAADRHAEEPPMPGPDAAAAPAAAGGRRRRSLVGGAERDEGTPSGQALLEERPEAAAEENVEPAEPIIEEAEFAEYGEEERFLDNEDGVLDDEDDGAAGPQELDPEWIEPTDEPSDLSPETLTAASVGTAASAVAMAASYESEESPLEPDTELTQQDALEADDVSGWDPSEEIDAPQIYIAAEVMAALRRPIVFRQFLPQSPGKDGLSFYGGAPIGPPDFQWPRERGVEGGTPLQFVMQWDCAQLSDVDPTGLLPLDGVLYCFVNFERGADEDYLASHVFVHHRGSVQAWGPIDIPEDAGPALGHLGQFDLSGCTDQVADAEQFVPRQLPRFPFAPIAFTHPISDEDGEIFWSDEHAADALLNVQKSGIAVREEVNAEADDFQGLGRPFPAFPHDFGAIRVLASRMIEALDCPDEFLAETLYPSLSEEGRAEQFAGWREEAKEIYLLGTQRSSDQKLDQNIADDIWQWFYERKAVIDMHFPDLIEEAVDLSLSVNSEALSNVPAHWIDRAMHSHALATEYEADNGGADSSRVRAVKPARMFGPVTAAPAAKELARDHILLLELPSGGGPGHHFNGKTLQYWITADDLSASHFDAVKSVVLEP